MVRRVGYVFAVALLAMAAPLAAEVTREQPNGFVSRHEALVKASPKEVWLALISPAGWWSSDHTWSGDAANLTLTPQAGGCFCETIPEVSTPGRFTLQGSVEHMRVIQAYPEIALRMQGALGPLQSEPVVGILTVAISEVKGGTRIVWEYNVGGPMRYEVPVIAKVVDGVMGAQLTGLAKLLGPVVAPLAPLPLLDSASDKPAGPKPDAKPDAKVDAALPLAKPADNAPVAKVPPVPAANSAAAPTAPKPAPQPASKPALKPASVEDAFADLDADPGTDDKAKPKTRPEEKGAAPKP
jgi:hypothetical protein